MRIDSLNILADCLREIGNVEVTLIDNQLYINGHTIEINDSLVKCETVSFRFENARRLIKGLQCEHIINLNDDQLERLVNAYSKRSNPFKQSREARRKESRMNLINAV
jgi:hypothetical protein